MTFRSDFMADLPADPGEALLLLSDRAQEWIDSPDAANDQANATYVQMILSSFLKRFAPEIFTGMNKRTIPALINAVVANGAQQEVDRLLDGYEESGAIVKNVGIADLTSEEKAEMHDHLFFIRSVIEQSELPSKKRNALFRQLNNLAKEIDKVGTRTDQFFGFISELGFNLGEFGKNSKPLIDRMVEMQRTIVKARARTDNIPLPKSDNMPQLPSPDAVEEDE